MSGLKDSVVLITGASSGIGAETARHFASLGSKLAIVARNVEKLEEVASHCREDGSPEVLVIPKDISNQEACGEVIQTTTTHFGGTKDFTRVNQNTCTHRCHWIYKLISRKNFFSNF